MNPDGMTKEGCLNACMEVEAVGCTYQTFPANQAKLPVCKYYVPIPGKELKFRSTTLMLTCSILAYEEERLSSLFKDFIAN